MRLLPALLLTLIQASSALAGTRLVAVLPIEARGKGIDESSRLALEEGIRSETGEALGDAGYTVLTGENTLRVLSDNGIDAAKACDASCALETARELKAELFVAGTITRSEGAYVAFVRLFSAQTGKQAAALELEGATVKEVRAKFRSAAKGFFEKALERVGEVPAEALAPTEPSSNRTLWIAGGVGVVALGAITWALLSAASDPTARTTNVKWTP